MVRHEVADVTIGGARDQIHDLFALPRFCDQSLDDHRRSISIRAASRGSPSSTRSSTSSITSIRSRGIRRIEREDGTYSAHCHGHRFFEEVAAMVDDVSRDEARSGHRTNFCGTTSARSNTRYGGVVGTSFRTFPSYPQRYIERLTEQLRAIRRRGLAVEPLRAAQGRRATPRTICTCGNSCGTRRDGWCARARSAPRTSLDPRRAPTNRLRPVRLRSGARRAPHPSSSARG